MIINNNLSKVNSYNSMYNAILTQQQMKNQGIDMYRVYYGTNQANGLSSSAKDFLAESKSNAQDLLDSINSAMKYGSGTGDVLVSSSNSKAVSVEGSKNTKVSDPIDIKVHQLAAAQKNTSSALNTTDTSALGAGTHDFTIDVNGASHNLSINIESGDSNEMVQRKMAQAINDADLGLNAFVTTNTKSNESALRVESMETGRGQYAGGQQFEIKDNGGSIVADLGITVDQYAVDASYSVNGKNYTSQSNKVDVGNGITATLKRASDKTVSITTGENTDYMKDAMKDIVDSYNKLLETANSNKNDRKTQRLIKSLTDIASSYGSSLDQIGIKVGSNGYLKIDEKKMDKAAEDGSLIKYLENESKSINYGFTQKLTRVASNVTRDPSYYISKDSFKDNNGFSSFFIMPSSYLSGNSRFANMGLLFDTFL